VASRIANRATGAARETRAALGIALDAPLPDLLGAVEASGAQVAILRLDRDLAGAFLPKAGLPLLVVNGLHGLPRQRFTLAHELGHLVLRHASVVDRPEAFSGYTWDPCEVQANAFAAEFLVPVARTRRWADEHVRGAVTLEDVVRFACRHGVSAPMARIRLETAGVVRDRRRLDRLDEEIADLVHHDVLALFGPNRLEDRLAEEAHRLPRLPGGLHGSALGAYLCGELALGELAARLGRPAAEVERTLRATGLAQLAPA
jgi:Zn-dependent peptidase ImmA (M78 family)